MGKLRVYCLKTLNKLSIYPPGNTPSAPSVSTNVPGSLVHCISVQYSVPPVSILRTCGHPSNIPTRLSYNGTVQRYIRTNHDFRACDKDCYSQRVGGQGKMWGWRNPRNFTQFGRLLRFYALSSPQAMRCLSAAEIVVLRRSLTQFFQDKDRWKPFEIMVTM